jgi:hypothetical protein
LEIREGNAQLTRQELCSSDTQAVHFAFCSLRRVEGAVNLVKVGIPIQQLDALRKVLGIV